MLLSLALTLFPRSLRDPGLFQTDRCEPPLFQTDAIMNILIRRRVATGQDLARRIPRGPQGSQSSLRTRVSGDYHAGHIFVTAGFHGFVLLL